MLLTLFLAHIVGDFLMQPRYIFMNKHRLNQRKLVFLHMLLYAVPLAAALPVCMSAYMNLTLANMVWAVLLIDIGHFLIDFAKATVYRKLRYRFLKSGRKKKWRSTHFRNRVFTFLENGKLALFIIDQLLHVILIVGIAQWLLEFDSESAIKAILGKLHFHTGVAYHLSDLSRGALLLCLIGFVTVFSGQFIHLLLEHKPRKGDWVERKETIEIDNSGEKVKTEHSYTNMEDAAKSRGKIIGYLERIAVMILTLKQAWPAIGFIITAKSFYRFKQLDNREWSEYFLVGTLASVLIGVFAGFVLLKFWWLAD